MKQPMVRTLEYMLEATWELDGQSRYIAFSTISVETIWIFPMISIYIYIAIHIIYSRSQVDFSVQVSLPLGNLIT